MGAREPEIGVERQIETTGFCRDCLAKATRGDARCGSCGSPRTIFHDELQALDIAHIDCDAFYASVEKRDRPELAGKPVIIGGGKRGVVSTACYVARIHGVHSAMPMFKALKACPEAVVIRPDMEKYSAVGREIRDLMRTLTPEVEPLSIDEAFLDLSGTRLLHGSSPAEVLARFAQTIEREVRLSVSIGLSHNKFLAKVASDLNKPRGFSVIGKAQTLWFLRQQPVSIVWGIGKVTQARLAKDGIKTIATVQDMQEQELAKRYGNMGIHLSRLARGLDPRRIESHCAAKSISAETTFNRDKATISELAPVLRSLAEKVSRRLKAKHLAGHTVVLKMKTANFRSRTRNRQLPDPTQLADRIFRTASELIEAELDGTKFRLIGVGVSTLCADDRADPDDLIDFDAQKRAAAERAMDNVRGRFGDAALGLGINFGRDRSLPQRDLPIADEIDQDKER